jgi:16S rRNA (adenine1518-N6/adenine1519-N6)-dimethyltransferase
MNLITFVDAEDNVIGSGTKQQAWASGAWHRLIRVFLFNTAGATLITRRSRSSSSPLKWNDSCAGHVDAGESYEAAALRELQEEIGVSGVALWPLTKLKYSETDEAHRVRNRFHMIYCGRYDGPIRANPLEVSEARWILPGELLSWMSKRPHDFTEGFKHAVAELRAKGLPLAGSAPDLANTS